LHALQIDRVDHEEASRFDGAVGGKYMADVDPGSGTGVAVLRLGLFGPTSFAIDGRELRFKSLKLRAALGYIALNESQTETRERLVGLLWSESGEDHARASLRQNIRELRVAIQGFDYAGLYIAGHEIGFERGSAEVDVLTVIAAAEAGKVHPLLLERRDLADELLAGLEDIDASFRSWLLAKRQTIRDRLLRALENALSNAGNDLAAEGSLAQAILNLDATHEDAARRLMRARAMMGDTAGALRVYKTLWDLLDEDYGMEPAEATQKLVADIKTGLLEPAVPMETPALPVPLDPSQPRTHQTRLWLFVQIVALREVDPEKSHLVMEFRQHLIASLIQFREWQVADAPAQATREALPAGSAGRYDIQMVAYQADDAVHMLITLKELDSGLYVWSQNFELNLENWFAVQRHVVRRIAMGLNVHISAERLQRFSDQRPVSLGIYDRWLRCQTLARTFNPQHWESLTQQYKEIIVEAPGFGPAFGGLADLHNTKHLFHPGVFRSRESERAALACARKAVELDPSDMRAHRSLAWSHLMAKQYDQAVMHMEVAYELNPNDSWTVISVAMMTAFGGQPERAIELSRIALDMTLAPSRTHRMYQMAIEFLNGNYEAAINAADHSLDGFWAVPAWRSAALAQLGRVDEASITVMELIGKVRANWFGADPPTNEAIIKWMFHLFPFRRREDWEHLRDGLGRASLPVGTIEFHDP
jgi:DNA-binding SARP family transcriptional activator/TolB-like protein